MHTVKWVAPMIEKALEKGVAKSYTYRDSVTGKKMKRERVIMEFIENESGSNYFEVTHYGTVILRLLLKDRDFQQILGWGGWSHTDARIINNVLVFFGAYNSLRSACSRKIDGSWELFVEDSYPTMLSAKEIREKAEELIEEITLQYIKGKNNFIKDDFSVWNMPEELPDVSITSVGYLSPTHVVNLNGRWVLGYTMSEILKFKNCFGKEDHLGKYLTNDEAERYVLTYVLEEVRQLLNEGFFYSQGENDREIEQRKVV